MTAIDLSDGALHITRENARDLGVSSRLLTMKADVMHAPPRGLGQFDIIVSNPPYVTEDEMQMPSVGSLIKEEIDNKKVAFIPTASLREGYTGYVGSARKLFNKLGATVTEIDISTEAYLTIQSVFEDADVIYFTGGNSFFLMDQLRKTGTDELLKKELAKGKLMIGESAGAIICAPTIQYIEQMDEKPEDYSQEDDAGLDLLDFYVLPHYLTAPFKKVTEKIMTEFSDLNLCPINNRQGNCNRW